MCPALAMCQKVFTVHSGGESCIFGVCEQGFSHGKYLHSHQRSILRILGALLAKSASIWSLACNVIKAAVTLPSRSYQNDTRGERNWKLGSPGAHLSEIKKKGLMPSVYMVHKYGCYLNGNTDWNWSSQIGRSRLLCGRTFEVQSQETFVL